MLLLLQYSLEVLWFLTSVCRSSTSIPRRELDLAVGMKLFNEPKAILPYKMCIDEPASLACLCLMVWITRNSPRLRSLFLLLIGFGECISVLGLIWMVHNTERISLAIYASFTGIGHFLGSHLVKSILMLSLTVSFSTKEERVYIFMRQKMIKFLSKLIVQVLLSHILTESQQLYFGTVCTFGSLGLIAMIVIIIFETTKQETLPKVGDDDTNSHRDSGYESESEKIERVDAAPPCGGWWRDMIVIMPVWIAFFSYWAQSGEFMYTYIMLKEFGLTPKELRLCDGVQYVGFSILLYLMTRYKLSPKIVLLLGVAMSLLSRFCLVVSFYEASFAIWIISALLSLPCPGSGEVLRGTAFAWTTCVKNVEVYMSLGVAVVNSAISWIYYISPCPFMVTCGLLSITLVLSWHYKLYGPRPLGLRRVKTIQMLNVQE